MGIRQKSERAIDQTNQSSDPSIRAPNEFQLIQLSAVLISSGRFYEQISLPRSFSGIVMAKCRNVAFGKMDERRESGPVERRWRAGMNNVDSLFFWGIYQVGVPITRSFRSVVPPVKMHPEIAMHLCALVEDEDWREGLHFFPSLLFLTAREVVLCSPLLFHSRILYIVWHYSRTLSIADFHPFLLPRVESTSILRHPVYIAGGDHIIVKRISVRFLRGANKTSLRASRVSYRPSCALHTRVPTCSKARALIMCTCMYMHVDGQT